TANPDAYELYLQGRFFWNKRSAPDLRKSIDCFNQAIAKDPNYALAYAGLAQAWSVLAPHNGGAPADCYPQADAAARKARALDNTFYSAHRNYGLALELQGKIPEAIAQCEKAAALTDDPIPLGMLGRIYGIAGRKDEAQKILERLRELRAQGYTAAYSLALVALGLGDKTEALHWLEEGYRDRDGDALGVIRVDPPLVPLHGDPRFEALAEKIVPARLFKSTTASK